MIIHDPIDDRIRAALGTELPDASRVEAAVRSQLRGPRRRWELIAASILVAALGLWALTRTPVAYAAAAAIDHHTEIVKGSPRRWRTHESDLRKVISEAGMSLEEAYRLAAQGYVLERAKICGVARLRTVHLVYARGNDRYSVYLRSSGEPRKELKTYSLGQEQVGVLETGRLCAMVVAPAPEFSGAARATQALLLN